MYLRFIGLCQDRRSRYEQGLIHLAYKLKYNNSFTDYEYEEVQYVFRWIDRNLIVPPILKIPGNYRCLCWFKPSAQEHIRVMWKLFSVIQNKGIAVDMIKCEEIGRIRYQDDYQIVAQPFTSNYRKKYN